MTALLGMCVCMLCVFLRVAIYQKFKLNEQIRFCTHAKALKFIGQSECNMSDCVFSERKGLLLDYTVGAKEIRSEEDQNRPR